MTKLVETHAKEIPRLMDDILKKSELRSSTKKELQELLGEKKKLEELTSQKESLGKAINRLQRGIDGEIKQEIEASHDYWPRNFENDQCPVSFKAHFVYVPQEFFTKKGLPLDLMPAPFREYCLLAIYGDTIFYKKERTQPQLTPIGMDLLFTIQEGKMR